MKNLVLHLILISSLYTTSIWGLSFEVEEYYGGAAIDHASFGGTEPVLDIAPSEFYQDEVKDNNDEELITESIELENDEEEISEAENNEVENWEDEVIALNTDSPQIDYSSSVYSLYDESEDKDGPHLGLGIGYRYLGHLNKIGIEKSLARQFSAGLYYGRYTGNYYGVEKGGLIPGFYHYSLELNFYLNSQKKAFHSGPLFKLGAHYNTLKNGVDALQIEVDGQKVIAQGENEWGPLFGAYYFWQWRYINLSIGAEYFTLGSLKSFVPLSASLGVAF